MAPPAHSDWFPFRSADPLGDTRTGDGGRSDGPPTGSFYPAPSPYREFVPHARGGIGEVFAATDPALHRTVAVKRLQERRADDPDARRRFLVEAEVTARLEHPGVVPVYALFTDERGGPAYAMRFVQGPTLSDAIAAYHAGRPDPVAFRRLLQCFIQVCQTVAYAHTRGVIHRDLKPQNILLGKFGETLVVDWGLAKVVGRPEEVRVAAPAEDTLVPNSDGRGSETAMGSAIGTPSYMSPEQAAGRWDVVAQSSDVYSLGAVLYTILTGRPPLEKGNWPEMQQRVQRGDFPRPRQVKPDTPRPLEAVCLKAMALDPPARYPSAESLAADIEHWMADEPVTARRDSLATRTRRWAKRHRTLVSTAAVVLVVAVAGLSVGAVILGRKNGEVEQQRQAAETAQRKAEAINRFLIDDLLKQADPENNPVGDKITVVALVDKAAARLDGSTALTDQPEAEAAVRLVIGQAFDNLGAYPKAERHYRRGWELRERAFGSGHPETLAARNKYVWAVANSERLEEAEREAVAAVEACTRSLGESHLETIDAMDTLASVYLDLGKPFAAEELARRSLELLNATVGPSHPRGRVLENNYAGIIARTRPAEAEAAYRRLVASRLAERPPPGDIPLVHYRRNLGHAVLAQGKFADAEPLLREAAEGVMAVFGPDSPPYLMVRNNLGYSLEGQGRHAEAEKEYLAVLADRRRLLPANHPDTRRTLAFLARLSARQDRWPDAASYLAELVVAQTPDQKRPLARLAPQIAAAFAADADPVGTEPTLQETHVVAKRNLWVGDWLTAELASRFGDCLRRQGKFAEAEPVLKSAANDVAKAIGVPAWGVAASRKRVADLYLDWKKPDEAAKWR